MQLSRLWSLAPLGNGIIRYRSGSLSAIVGTCSKEPARCIHHLKRLQHFLRSSVVTFGSFFRAAAVMIWPHRPGGHRTRRSAAARTRSRGDSAPPSPVTRQMSFGTWELLLPRPADHHSVQEAVLDGRVVPRPRKPRSLRIACLSSGYRLAYLIFCLISPQVLKHWQRYLPFRLSSVPPTPATPVGGSPQESRWCR